jgi:hypothetical protein
MHMHAGIVNRQLACMMHATNKRLRLRSLAWLTHGAGGVRAAVERGMRPEPLRLRLHRGGGGGHGERQQLQPYMCVSLGLAIDRSHTQFLSSSLLDMYDPVVIEAAKDTTNGDYDRYISQTTGRCVRAVRPGDGKGWRVATGRSNSGKRAVRHLPSWHMRSLAQGSR